MTSSNRSQVGDTKSPASRKTVEDLRVNVDLSAGAPAMLPSPTCASSPTRNAMLSVAADLDRKTSPSTCLQNLWFSFFFDGTGNNLEADIELEKHSNIARLYRAHLRTNVGVGIHSIYIPGIGTYFREIGDPGGTVRGAAFGSLGEARLNFALNEFDRFLKSPLARAASPINAISDISIAVFGFSRGAALARAFVNLLMETRCSYRSGKWILSDGGWPVRFRFMGLFDTVASVGQPMSRNNTDYYNPAISDVRGMLDERIDDYKETQPVRLAFSHQGTPGADPAPGPHAGHESWGSELHIHESVAEVRHFVAAHEIRNSFPLDSISTFRDGNIIKPAHFYETIYPGAHSDVGGGYAVGEGGKSFLPEDSLSRIPLRHMYEFAVSKGVPMFPESRLYKSDFKTSSELIETYNKYLLAVGAVNNLGEGVNRQVKLQLAWRFINMKNRIRNGAKTSESLKIHDDLYKKIKTSQEPRLKELEKNLIMAQVSLAATEEIYKQSNASNDAVKKARELVESKRHDYLKAKAENDAVPDMSRINALTELYDKQLLVDVESIRSRLQSQKNPNSRKNLRPHYRGLIESYENEVLEVNKTKDEAVIRLFEQYVHDSLSGFGRDATFPSDPRVIYLGNDEKMRYADLSIRDRDTMTG